MSAVEHQYETSFLRDSYEFSAAASERRRTSDDIRVRK